MLIEYLNSEEESRDKKEQCGEKTNKMCGHIEIIKSGKFDNKKFTILDKIETLFSELDGCSLDIMNADKMDENLTKQYESAVSNYENFVSELSKQDPEKKTGWNVDIMAL
jgi:hypothetical protein